MRSADRPSAPGRQSPATERPDRGAPSRSARVQRRRLRAGAAPLLVGAGDRRSSSRSSRALSARYSVSLFPPGLDEKEDVTLHGRVPHPRLERREPVHPRAEDDVRRPGRRPRRPAARAARPSGGEETERRRSSVQSIPLVAAPDLNTLVRTANLYPFIIESDSVADYRARRSTATCRARVSALGVTSVVTANRVELSEIPVIKLIAVAGSSDDAVALADKTAQGVHRLARGAAGRGQAEDPAGGPDRRSSSSPCRAGAIASAGPSTTLPVLVFLVVFAAFCVLAILLDRLLPATAAGPLGRRAARAGQGQEDGVGVRRWLTSRPRSPSPPLDGDRARRLRRLRASRSGRSSARARRSPAPPSSSPRRCSPCASWRRRRSPGRTRSRRSCSSSG